MIKSILFSIFLCTNIPVESPSPCCGWWYQEILSRINYELQLLHGEIEFLRAFDPGSNEYWALMGAQEAYRHMRSVMIECED